MGGSEYNDLLNAASTLASEPKLGDSAWEVKAIDYCIRLHELERTNQLGDSGREVFNKLALALKKSQSLRSESP